MEAWVLTRTLWVSAPDGSEARRLDSAGTGVYSPAWSRDGHHLLYLRDNAVWLIGVEGGEPARIVGPFPEPPQLFGYYGHVIWSHLLTWDRR
ncbi:MAG: hypothetical protein K6U74_20490 [Firmicutes bacterium]|nr:hypothetical protein [Bacillota bacterium]